MHFWYNSNLN